MEIDKIIKREVISLVISIIMILLVFIGVSYAAFFSVAEGEKNVISFGDIDLKFCNDISCNKDYTNYGQTIGVSNTDGVASPLSIYPYESDSEALKNTPYIFNVTNTGTLKLYIDVLLEEDNDFIPSENYSSYTQTTELYSNNIKVGIGECTNGIPDINTVKISSYGNLIDNKILTAEELNVNENKTYCLWTWLDEKTPNNVQSTYFVANLSVSGEYKPFTPTLRNKILADNESYADNVKSEYVGSETGIDFSLTSSDTNGKGLYYTTDTTKTEYGKRIYYFRGDVKNNYVVFGGYCWKAVRTSENLGVKLIYAGITNSNTCSNDLNSGIAVSNYTNSISTNSNDILSFINSNNEGNNIKEILDAWYKSEATTNEICWDNNLMKYSQCDFSSQTTSLSSYNNYIEEANYCNDRTTQSLVGSNALVYSGLYRANTTNSPSLRCNSTNDKITSFIGALTSDEINYAGASYNKALNNLYLNKEYGIWTISPAKYDNGVAYALSLDKDGMLIENKVDAKLSVVPVITINSKALVSSGTGLASDPYIINTTK